MRHAAIERNKCSLNNGDTKIAIIGFKVGIGVGVLKEEAYLFVGVILNTRHCTISVASRRIGEPTVCT